jgi:hypothetical protein
MRSSHGVPVLLCISVYISVCVCLCVCVRRYERYENNGWRPVAERVLLDEDPVTTMTRLKRQPLFHHNPAVRR